MGHGDFTAPLCSCFFRIFTKFTKNDPKTIFKIEIRVKFIKIRGYIQLVPFEMQVQSSYLGENRLGRTLGRPEIGVFLYIFLSNGSCTCICNGFNQQIPPYLSEFHSDLTL